MNIPAWDEKLTTNKVVSANLKLAPYMAVTGRSANSRTWGDSVTSGHIMDNPDLVVEALLCRAIINTKHEPTAKYEYTKLISAGAGSSTVGRVAGYQCVLRITPSGYTMLTNVCGVRVRVTKQGALYNIVVEETYIHSSQSQSVADTLRCLCGLNRSPVKYKLGKLVSYRELRIGSCIGAQWLSIDCAMIDGKLRIGDARCGQIPATRPTKGASKIVKEALALLTPVVETIILMEPKCSNAARGTWNRYDVVHHMKDKVICGMTIEELQELLTVELRKGIESDDIAVLVPTTAQLSYFVRVIYNLNT
jgi:hypothetical protein